MKHRISAGALVLRNDQILLVRHQKAGSYDFWAPPGGGVEDSEELAAAAEREVLEETGVHVRANRLAYIDELIDESGRMIKFWFVADYLKGEIDLTANPAVEEAITEGGWFPRERLPEGHVFPQLLLGQFWNDVREGFPRPVKLPLQHSIF